ncbi:MAG: NAD(P)/FAD-dependent oxidoreductase [Promethearchaeota archaeon]
MTENEINQNLNISNESKQNINEILVNVAVIGGGPAGMGAALAAYKAEVKVIIIERDFELGGILQQCIHNGFGLSYYKEELTGPEYAQRFIEDIKQTRIQVLLDSMVINITPDKVITVINSDRGIIKVKADSIVLAMGCRERTRGAINIPGTRPAGIYSAGTAQRLINMEGFFPGKRVFILGSGDIGLIMARRLTLEGMEVLGVAEILPYCSGLTRNFVQCLQDYNIPLYLKHTITAIRGEERVEEVTISKVDENWNPISGTEKIFKCDTILFSVGLIPENELSSKAGVELGKTNGPLINEYLETNISGIFACGNCLQVHDLVDWVTLEGERAGKLAADHFFGIYKSGKLLDPIKTKPGNNVGYIVPNRIDYLSEGKEIQFSFRVKKPDKNCTIEFVSKKKIFFKRKAKHVIPSEMFNIKVQLNLQEIGEEIIINIGKAKKKGN